MFQTLHVASKTFVYWICSNPEDFIAPFLFSAVLGLQASEQKITISSEKRDVRRMIY